MKRVRNEQMQSSISNYLKRRAYTGGAQSAAKSGESLRSDKRSVREASLVSLVDRSARLNAMSFSGVSADATTYDQQFTKLKQFIHDAPGIHQPELRDILFPVFSHIYLELLCNGHTTPGHKFYGRHVALFREQTSRTPFLQGLERLQSRGDVLSTKEVVDFRNQKFKVCFAEATVSHLMRHLKTDDNVHILQMLNQHVDIKIKSQDRPGGLDLNSPRGQSGCVPLSPPLTPDNKVIQDEITLSTLKQCIERVRTGPQCLPSVCVYSLRSQLAGVTCADFSSDNSRLCAGFDDSSISVWSLDSRGLAVAPSGGQTARVDIAADYFTDDDDTTADTQSEVSQSNVTLRGHHGAVYRVTFLDSDRHLFSCSEDTTVRLWNVSTRNTLAVYRGHNYPVWDLDVSHTSGQFASCCHDNTAKLWTTDRVYPTRSFIGHTSDVDCIRFHPNGTYLATGSSDRTVRLWRLSDAKCVRLFTGHLGPVLTLAFSPDGRYLAASGEERHVKVWDMGSGKLYQDLRGHTDAVNSLSCSINSASLCSGGFDGLLRVWDVTEPAVTTSVDNTTGDKTSSNQLLASYPTNGCITSLKYAKHNIIYAAVTCT